MPNAPQNELIYELRAVDAPKLALTVTSNSKTNGAAAILYDSNGYQCQRFKAYVDNGTWWFAAQHSSKVLASYDTSPSAGGKVCQWTYAANKTWCQWELTDTGSAVIDGTEYYTAKLKRKGTSLYADGTQPLNGTSYNVLLQAASDRAQEFAFVPVTAYWKAAPVPYDCCIAASTSGKRGQVMQDTDSVYVGFHISKLYDVAMRYRTRTLDLRGNWSSWSAWSAWDVQSVTTGNGYYWTESIPTSFTISSAKCMEVNVQMCSQAAYEGTLYYGNTSDNTFRVALSPTVDFTGAVISPEGLKISYTSNYSPTKIIFSQIGSYKGAYEVGGLGTAGTVDIPLGVCGWYADGASVALKYKVGNDVLSEFDGTRSDTVTVSSSGGSISPTYTLDDYGVLTISGVTDANGYLICDGEVYEGMSFPIPLNKAFDVWVVKDGQNWGVKKKTYTAQTVSKACHVIAGEKTLILSVNANAGLTEDISTTAQATSAALDGAKWMHVGMSGTRDGSVTVNGVLARSDASKASDVHDLVGTHGLWRGPFGTLFRVAITSASTVRENKLTTVTVSLEVEA